MFDLIKAKELWEAGSSATMIANEMGVSRNVVMGQVHRNREMFEPRRKSWRGAAVNQKPRKTRLVCEKVVSADVTRSKPVDAKKEYDASRAPFLKPLWLLRSTECHWSLSYTDQHMFCAAEGSGRFCEHHHSRLRRQRHASQE